MRPWSRSGCLSLTPGSSPLSRHDGGRSSSPGPASCTRIAPSWSARQWRPWPPLWERSDHVRHPRSSPTLANPPSHQHGPPAVPNPQISQSLKLPRCRPTWLPDCQFRKARMVRIHFLHLLSVDPHYTHTQHAAQHSRTHMMQPALGFSGSFPLLSSLCPRQNLFPLINPFESAPPRLTCRLHLPFSNAQTTSSRRFPYLASTKEPHIPFDPSPSNPTILSRLNLLYPWSPPCGYCDSSVHGMPVPSPLPTTPVSSVAGLSPSSHARLDPSNAPHSCF